MDQARHNVGEGVSIYNQVVAKKFPIADWVDRNVTFIRSFGTPFGTVGKIISKMLSPSDQLQNLQLG